MDDAATGYRVVNDGLFESGIHIRMQSFTMNYVQNFSVECTRIQPLFVDGMTAV